MRKIGLAAPFAFMLIFAVASMGHAQSAEDLVKGQSPGVRYVCRDKMDGVTPSTIVIYIRGNELTWSWEEGPSKGLHTSERIVSNRPEGNKLIFLTTSGREYVVDGYRLIARDPKTGQDTSGVFTRE
jgi:hypothetical protein